MHYNVIIIGGGPGGIFSAYELTKDRSDLRVAVFEAGHSLEKRHCPIDGDKVKSCIRCKSCSIMSGFGGAGAFSDGKYNITNDFGGTLHEYIGKKQALDLMHYVDEINMAYGGEGTKLYSTAGTKFKKLCIQNKLNLLDASVRHLGTDVNLVVLSNLYDLLKDKVDFYFDSPVTTIARGAMATVSPSARRTIPATSASSPSAASAASGWRACARSSRSPRSRTASISVCASRSPPSSSPT